MLNVKEENFQSRIFRLWSDVVNEYKFEIFEIVELDIYIPQHAVAGIRIVRL